ncbi:3-oxoacyl-[acyl-carrier protein] reductase [Evansella vedderi]|uniref:3-oxoacyl-[acyl-carrier protein] reductase n=1 Tax=Evansella vedderi TaxID=38282 RepID=A0ABT9ZPS9_9BACI|nr:glucose 1-dehydrogenase [Evansella vedderi]MDQ0253248.1 3-oxoacyl-[acyl-carrier protein] reductase [Evansella vedderi]
MRLQGKTFIITGAAGGMGSVTVKRFLEEGANVVGSDLHVSSLQEQLENFLPVQGDLTKEADVAFLVKKTYETFGKIDGLVNIAGVAQKLTPIEELTLSDWDRMMSINATTLFLTNQAVVPYLKKQQGVIVNVASISAVRPRPGLSAYIASKGAAVSFSQALAIELADDQVRVNVIHPGPSDTKMLGQFVGDSTEHEKVKDDVFKNSVPLGELIQPIDIANAAVYLCSEEARMVTGAVLHVDGGRGL